MFNFLLETFRLGLKNLRLHKLRSLLTALGIIIGVAAVIIMVAIGEGGKQAARKQMEQLGATNIVIRSIPPPEGNEATGKSQRTLDYGLKRSDLDRLKSLPSIVSIVPIRNAEQKIVANNVKAGDSAIGTTPDMFEVIKLRIERGQAFTKLQYDNADQVCVLGSTASRRLFPYQDPLGAHVMIGTAGMGTAVCTVIGVLEPTGLRAGADTAGVIKRDYDQDVYFPLTLAQQTFGDTITKRQAGSMERKQIELSEIWLEADSTENVERLASQAENILRTTHPNLRDIEVKAPIQILRNAEQVNRIFNFILVGIASFALLVGGIGIMNIMLASVTERTKEIGIRRALGAKRKHITLQFLIETTVISLTGGLIGIAAGIGAAKLLPVLVQLFDPSSNYPTKIAQWSVVGSFIVSGVIGIGFGLYPAIMAARMNPIEALRHE